MRKFRVMAFFLLVIVFAKAFIRIGVRRNALGRKFTRGRRQMIEISVCVDAAHQQRRQACRASRPRMRGNITDAEADPPVRGAIVW